MPEDPEDDKLAKHAPPRRAAARKASKLAAAQLDSSPIPSGAENAGVSFGEPSTPKSAVKFRYGGKRKYKQSPSKSSPLSHAAPPSARPRSKSLVERSPTKQKSNGRGRGGRRARGGSRKAPKTRPRSLSISSSSLDSSEPPTDAEAARVGEEHPRASSSGDAMVPAAARAGVSGKTNDQTGVAKGTKKRPLSVSSDEGSLLTPLSSPEAQKVPESDRMPVLAPRMARQLMRFQSQAEPSASTAKKNTLKQTKSFDHIFVLDSTDDESFDDVDVGSLVWVSIDLEGNLRDVDEGESDILWWPAKVEFPRPCMRVSLFGSPPGATPGDRQLDVPSPSPSNVRSMLHNGRIRFSEADYRPSQSRSTKSSPRKKRKLDVDFAWKEARDLMLKAGGTQDEHISSILPPPDLSKAGTSSALGKRAVKPFPSLDSRRSKGKGKAKARGKGRGSDLSDIEDTDLSDLDLSKAAPAWRAPSADPLLDLPGELVLAKEGKARTQYWPAKLLEYIKPQNPRQRPKYRALFFDGTVLSIEPDWFWTTTDDEFGTCKLGESTGNYGLDSDIDDAEDGNDAEDFNRPFAPGDDEGLRAPSPLPALPPPAAEVFEYEMPIAEQFEYVKPVLAAVLEGKYGPARERHEGFMRGAGARQKVLDAVPVRGSLSARDKEEVAYLVRSWARRRERRLEMGVNVEYPPDKLYSPESGAAREADGHNDGAQGDSDADSVLTAMSDVSGGDTEPLAPFEAEPPPSSFAEATEGGETDDDEKARGVISEAPASDENNAVSSDAKSANLAAENAVAREVQDVRAQDEPAVVVATAGAENHAGDETLLRPPPRTTFHDLDAVEKITYCNNVLLQEAILQLLLWRTGQRKALGLLSPEEEQRLHDAALVEGEKTNWVHDIIRIRQAVERTMLPTTKGKGKATDGAPSARVRVRRAM